MYNWDLILKLFDGILVNRTTVTKIKVAIVEIKKENNKIFEEEQEDKPMQNVTNPQENCDCDNLPIDLLDSLLASPQITTHNGSFINIPNKDELNLGLKPDLSFM